VADNAKVVSGNRNRMQLLQKDPGNPESGQLESGYGAPVGPNAASILRRYEFFKYAASTIRRRTRHWSAATRIPRERNRHLHRRTERRSQLDVAAIQSRDYALMLGGLGFSHSLRAADGNSHR